MAAILTDEQINMLIDGYEAAKELIDLLLDSIDHAYLQTDGTYGDLAYEVADKVEFIKNIRYANRTIRDCN